MIPTNQTHTWLQQWLQQHLVRLEENSLLHQCDLVVITDLKQYNQFIGNNKAQALKYLPPSQWFWGIVRQSDQQLLSTLHITHIYCNVDWNESKQPQHILQWSYAFTKSDSTTRRQGLNTALRLASMSWAKEMGYHYINSVPFPDAYSKGILEKLGFKKFDQSYIYHLNK